MVNLICSRGLRYDSFLYREFVLSWCGILKSLGFTTKKSVVKEAHEFIKCHKNYDNHVFNKISKYDYYVGILLTITASVLVSLAVITPFSIKKV